MAWTNPSGSRSMRASPATGLSLGPGGRPRFVAAALVGSLLPLILRSRVWQPSCRIDVRSGAHGDVGAHGAAAGRLPVPRDEPPSRPLAVRRPRALVLAEPRPGPGDGVVGQRSVRDRNVFRGRGHDRVPAAVDGAVHPAPAGGGAVHGGADRGGE